MSAVFWVLIGLHVSGASTTGMGSADSARGPIARREIASTSGSSSHRPALNAIILWPASVGTGPVVGVADRVRAAYGKPRGKIGTSTFMDKRLQMLNQGAPLT